MLTDGSWAGILINQWKLFPILINQWKLRPYSDMSGRSCFDQPIEAVCLFRYDQWELGPCSDAHVPAALLKLWLRELYVPLIPGRQDWFGVLYVSVFFLYYYYFLNLSINLSFLPNMIYFHVTKKSPR